MVHYLTKLKRVTQLSLFLLLLKLHSGNGEIFDNCTTINYDQTQTNVAPGIFILPNQCKLQKNYASITNAVIPVLNQPIDVHVAIFANLLPIRSSFLILNNTHRITVGKLWCTKKNTNVQVLCENVTVNIQVSSLPLFLKNIHVHFRDGDADFNESYVDLEITPVLFKDFYTTCLATHSQLQFLVLVQQGNEVTSLTNTGKLQLEVVLYQSHMSARESSAVSQDAQDNMLKAGSYGFWDSIHAVQEHYDGFLSFGLFTTLAMLDTAGWSTKHVGQALHHDRKQNVANSISWDEWAPGYNGRKAIAYDAVRAVLQRKNQPIESWSCRDSNCKKNMNTSSYCLSEGCHVDKTRCFGHGGATWRYFAQHSRLPNNLVQQRLGVAFNANIALVRIMVRHHHIAGNDPYDTFDATAEFLEEGLRWVLQHHVTHNITVVSIGTVDTTKTPQRNENNCRLNTPVITQPDLSPLIQALLKQNIVLIGSAGNVDTQMKRYEDHDFDEVGQGLCFPGVQEGIIAVSAQFNVHSTQDTCVRGQGNRLMRLDCKNCKVKLIICEDIGITSAAVPVFAGFVTILLEAITKIGFNWNKEGKTMSEAVENIFHRTGDPLMTPCENCDIRCVNISKALYEVVGF